MENKRTNPTYDYTLQVWYDPDTRLILSCGHPTPTPACCNAGRLHGTPIDDYQHDTATP